MYRIVTVGRRRKIEGEGRVRFIVGKKTDETYRIYKRDSVVVAVVKRKETQNVHHKSISYTS